MPGDAAVNSADLILALLDEAYETRTWHGPNLKQSIRGVTAQQAAFVYSERQQFFCAARARAKPRKTVGRRQSAARTRAPRLARVNEESAANSARREAAPKTLGHSLSRYLS